MEIQNEIFKYIKNEKDISKKKIAGLENKKYISPSKKRILSIEKEFLNLPLEKMSFEDVADAAAAISIYRTSRNLFYQLYKVKFRGPDKQNIFNKVLSKYNFLSKIGRELTHTRVQELNLIQNSDFFYDLVKRQALKNETSIEMEKRQLDKLSLDEMLEIEPLTIAKKRARAQATFFSIGRFILEEIKNLSPTPELEYDQLITLDKSLDKIVDNIRNNIFKYYNSGLKILPKYIQNTMGKNSYLEKMHELINVLDFDEFKKFGSIPKPLSVVTDSYQIPMIGNIFWGIKKPIVTTPNKDSERNIQNKVYGILLPIPRKGNEKMTLLYKDIKIDSIDIGHLFSDSFSNVKAIDGKRKIYYKAILLHPLWKIIELSESDYAAKYFLSQIINLPEQELNNLDFEDDNIINKINKLPTDFLKISSESVVLAAKTRSEEEGLTDIFALVNSKISEIQEDYCKRFSPTNEMFFN